MQLLAKERLSLLQNTTTRTRAATNRMREIRGALIERQYVNESRLRLALISPITNEFRARTNRIIEIANKAMQSVAKQNKPMKVKVTALAEALVEANAVDIEARIFLNAMRENLT